VKLGYTRIKAPIDGRIGTVQVTPGNLVRAGDTGTGLVTITQVKPVRVAFTLPERELSGLRDAVASGKPPVVHVRPNGQEKAVTSAPVSFIDSAVDTQSGTITVRAEFPNEGLELWPGQYVDVQVDLRTRPDTITVPTVAVQTGQDSPYVFVARPDGTAELRKIVVLAAQGGRTAVAEGLAAGENVVVDGQLRLSDGAAIRTGKDQAPKPVAQNTEARS
jgi:multidrug efflux system membrane fusion protein